MTYDTIDMLPLSRPFITIYIKDNIPPMKSHKILQMLHPSVLCNLLFLMTCGIYLTKEMTSFSYPIMANTFNSIGGRYHENTYSVRV